MATISFKENVCITDDDKILEILRALRQPSDNSIKPAIPPSLPKDVGSVWFNRSKT